MTNGKKTPTTGKMSERKVTEAGTTATKAQVPSLRLAGIFAAGGGLVCVGLSAALGSIEFAKAAVAGAGLCGLNLLGLRMIVAGSLNAGENSRPLARMMIFVLLSFFALVGLTYGAVIVLQFNALGFILGFSAVLFGLSAGAACGTNKASCSAPQGVGPEKTLSE